MSMQDLQYTNMFLQNLQGMGKTNPIQDLAGQASNLAALGQLQAFPQFRQDMMAQASNPEGPNMQGMMSSLASYDPKAYASMADDMMRAQKVDKAQIDRDNRALAVEQIPVANDAADRYRQLAIDIGKTNALIDSVNNELSKEADSAKKTLLAERLGEYEKQLVTQRDAVSASKLAYSDAIKKVAVIPGLQGYVTSKLSPAEEIVADRNIKEATLKLQNIRVLTEPMLAEAAVKTAGATSNIASMNAQKLATELGKGTQAEQENAAYANRMDLAETSIQPLNQMEIFRFLHMDNTALSQLADSPALQAAVNWTSAKLRQESGASIAPSEYAGALAVYIPKAVEGDDWEGKRMARLKAAQDMRKRGASAGAGASGGITGPAPVTPPAGKPAPKRKPLSL